MNCVLTTICSLIILSLVFPPQKISHVNQVISFDSSPLSPDNCPALPPPLPIKSRGLMPQDLPHSALSQAEDGPSDSPPPLTRGSTARVSFREPISSSYSVEEDEDEDGLLQEVEENQQDVDEEEEGGFGSRLRLQKGVPPQMDLLGK